MAVNLRRGISQIGATTNNKTLNRQLLEALMEQELQSEERIMERNKAWEIEAQNRKERADAAKASGLAQLGGTAVTAGLLLKDTELGKSLYGGAKKAVTGGYEIMKSAVGGTQEAVAGSTPGVIPNAGMATAAGVGTAGTIAPISQSSTMLGTQVGEIAPVSLGVEGIGGAGVGVSATGEATTAVTGGTATGAGSSIGSTVFPALAGAGIGSLGANLLFPGNSTAEDIGTIGGAALTGFMVGGPVGGLVGGAIGVVFDLVEDASIICTELNRQGYLPDVILALDTIHGKRNIDCYTYIGYRHWADTIVKWMQKSKLVTRIVKPFARAWAYEMASRIDSGVKGNLLGKVLLKVGVPICRYIGKKKMEDAVWAS